MSSCFFSVEYHFDFDISFSPSFNLNYICYSFFFITTCFSGLKVTQISYVSRNPGQNLAPLRIDLYHAEDLQKAFFNQLLPQFFVFENRIFQATKKVGFLLHTLVCMWKKIPHPSKQQCGWSYLIRIVIPWSGFWH